MQEDEIPRTTVHDLRQDWQTLVETEKMSGEAQYRIGRLIERSGPIEGKMFVKTVKGRELISQCAERTRALRDRLRMPGEVLYKSLTELETCYEELVKKTYEFRVKAG
jgi:hypothetical protein